MTRRELRPTLLLAGLLVATPALALDGLGGEGPPPAAQRVTPPAATALPPPLPPGERTYRLLEQQRAGNLASPHAQWLSGDVQHETYWRYVESFSRPIPELFIDDDFSD